MPPVYTPLYLDMNHVLFVCLMSSLLWVHAAHNYHSQLILFPISMSFVFEDNSWKIVFRKTVASCQQPLALKDCHGKKKYAAFSELFHRSEIQWAMAYLLRDVAHTMLGPVILLQITCLIFPVYLQCIITFNNWWGFRWWTI